jgi:hypothetical protein
MDLHSDPVSVTQAPPEMFPGKRFNDPFSAVCT